MDHHKQLSAVGLHADHHHAAMALEAPAKAAGIPWLSLLQIIGKYAGKIDPALIMELIKDLLAAKASTGA